MPDRFAVGDRVERLRCATDRRPYWRVGVVVMVVPAGVSPYAMFRRWFRDKGTCMMRGAVKPVFNRELVIVEVVDGGRRRYYCPCLNTIRKV